MTLQDISTLKDILPGFTIVLLSWICLISLFVYQKVDKIYRMLRIILQSRGR